jgi:hypothetical protein
MLALAAWASLTMRIRWARDRPVRRVHLNRLGEVRHVLVQIQDGSGSMQLRTGAYGVGECTPNGCRGHSPADRHPVPARERAGVALRVGQRADQGNPFLHDSATDMTNERLERALRDGELDVAAGTVWLWARPGMADSVDTLFVNEAGQLSLANVLAVAGAARNLVLLGDPQQLAQPSQATHPPGAGASALGHILGERATMPAGAGLLLDQTYRMHPDLCRHTSEVFYDGKLHGAGGSAGRRSWVPGRSAGRACAWWRWRTRATRTRRRRRPARWRGWESCWRAARGGTGTVRCGRSAGTGSWS